MKKLALINLFLILALPAIADDDKRSDNERRDNQFSKTRDVSPSGYDWSKLERDGNSNDSSSTDEIDRGTIDRPGDSRD
jgi:hypothetical protein